MKEGMGDRLETLAH